MLWLSYTLAKRYERCGELARQWKLKLVRDQIDQKPFFVGRVVHDCFHEWLTHDGTALGSYLEAQWKAEEAKLAPIPYALRWVEGERDREFERASTLLAQLERDATGLRKLKFASELKYRVALNESIGMYANPDIWGEHPTAPVAYIVELKSGVSFDPAQVDWYGAVATAARHDAQLPPLRLIAVALRPATDEPVTSREITTADMVKQMQRAYDIGAGMLRGEWEARSQGFCSMCEGRDGCHDYQAKFGGLRAGRVSLNGA